MGASQLCSTLPAQQICSFFLLLLSFLKASFRLCFHWSQPNFREFPFLPTLPGISDTAVSAVQTCFLVLISRSALMPPLTLI